MTDSIDHRPGLLWDRFPSRATVWQLRTRTLSFGAMPVLMGIVNVTPDSFSDGGRFHDHQDAVEHGLRLAAEGAAILDVGGECTRPYAQPVEESEELHRVVQVVGSLAAQTEVRTEGVIHWTPASDRDRPIPALATILGN